jgi:hypothetical protein
VTARRKSTHEAIREAQAGEIELTRSELSTHVRAKTEPNHLATLTRRKASRANFTAAQLEAQLPSNWRWQVVSRGRSWRAVAWTLDGRFVEGRARTYSLALAALSNSIRFADRVLWVVIDESWDSSAPPPEIGRKAMLIRKWGSDATRQKLRRA